MKDDETVRQAKRALDRLGEEGGLSATPVMKSAANSVRDHFTAKDADKTDSIEVWGTRIARGLALVAFVGLVMWMVGQVSL
jgi:NAD(P)H-hydrate repair Nnr-like enzyme with NAD(P)H-hydrate epimerase domain